MSRLLRVVVHAFAAIVVACAAAAIASAQTSAPARSAQTPAPASPSLQQQLERIRSQVYASPTGLRDAVPELQRILAEDPSIAEAHLLLGAAYRTAGTELMIGEAKAELQQALELDPGLIAARLLLAQTYFDLGRYENARDEATIALRQVPGQAQFLAILGEAERHLGDPARAKALASLALEADGTLTQAHYYRARAMLDLGERDDAIKELEGVIRSGAEVPDVFLYLGIAYIDANRLDDAVLSLTEGASLAPASREMKIELAHAYRLKGQLANAEQQLTQARSAETNVQVTPEYQRIETRLNLEWGLLRLRQGRLQAAATALSAAVTMNPNDGASHRALAEVYLRQGAYAKARDEAAQARTLGAPLAADLQQRLDRAPATTPPAPPTAPPAKGRE
jgi:tetratricopeptide (TPR) repeat protein